MSGRKNCKGGKRDALSGRLAREIPNQIPELLYCYSDEGDSLQTCVLSVDELITIVDAEIPEINSSSTITAEEVSGPSKVDWRTVADIGIDVVRDKARRFGRVIAEFGWKGRFYYKSTAGKLFIIFKGYASTRNVFNGIRYLQDHAKVLSYGLAKSQVVASAVKVNPVSIFVLTGLNILETIISDDKDFIDATAQFSTDMVKIIAATVAGAAAAVAVASAATLIALPAVAIVGAGFVVAVAVSLALDYVDNTLGITSAIADALRKSRDDFRAVREEASRTLSWCNSPQGAYACMRRMFHGF